MSPYFAACPKALSFLMSSIILGSVSRLGICLFNSAISKFSASPFDFIPFSDFSSAGVFSGFDVLSYSQLLRKMQFFLMRCIFPTHSVLLLLNVMIDYFFANHICRLFSAPFKLSIPFRSTGKRGDSCNDHSLPSTHLLSFHIGLTFFPSR